MFWPGCTSNGIGTWTMPGNVLPVALLTHLWPSFTGPAPVAFHTRPPSFVTDTWIIFTSPAAQLIGTLSLTQSALQSAPRKYWSRTGVPKSEFHQDPLVWRSQRTM